MAVEARSTNTKKKKKENSPNKKHQIFADADRYTGTKKKRHTSYFPSNSPHPSTQNQSKTHKLSTPATKPSAPLHNSDRSSITKIQIPTTFILLIRPNSAFHLSIRIYEHSKQTNARFTPLRRPCQRKKNACKKLLPGRQWRRLGRIRLRGPIVHCGRRQRRAKRGRERKPRRLRKSMTGGIALAGKFEIGVKRRRFKLKVGHFRRKRRRKKKRFERTGTYQVRERVVGSSSSPWLGW